MGNIDLSLFSFLQSALCTYIEQTSGCNSLRLHRQKLTDDFIPERNVLHFNLDVFYVQLIFYIKWLHSN